MHHNTRCQAAFSPGTGTGPVWKTQKKKKYSKESRGKNMRKPDLVDAIADRADLTKDKATDALNILLDEITKALERKESVNLIGFGSFESRERGARMGKNPQTGEPIQIKASTTVGFKPGKALKEAVND
ncbi:HU family DNA-binding protein [Kistimonas scapharcae]